MTTKKYGITATQRKYVLNRLKSIYRQKEVALRSEGEAAQEPFKDDVAIWKRVLSGELNPNPRAKMKTERRFGTNYKLHQLFDLTKEGKSIAKIEKEYAKKAVDMYKHYLDVKDNIMLGGQADALAILAEFTKKKF